MIEEHLSPAERLASGLRALPDTAKAFASTQAAWRFYQNPRVTLRRLAQTLIAAGREAVARDCSQYALAVHDWSNLHYNQHCRKEDRVSLSQSADLGYELQTVLLVSDGEGRPLAPVSLSLRAADGVHCSREWQVRPPQSPLDELMPVMDFVAKLKLAKPVVHVIDREADSAAHYRAWHAQGHCFLVRADEDRLADHQGKERSLREIRELLRERDAFHLTCEVQYHGKLALQWVAESEVTLTRPARPQRRDGEPRRTIPGPPLTLRLVISEVRDAQGNVLAVWFLLTNLPATVETATIALWYYWRWRIESYFKLLKSAGHEAEHWQQESAASVARRLMVAAMACVVVWQLERDKTAEGEELRNLLVRLSGRQMKRGKPFTAPALLAGMWVFLAMLYVLELYHVEDLRRLARQLFPQSRAGP